MRARTPPGLWALAAWGALIVATWLWGTLLNDAGTEIMLDAPPLYGKWDLRLNVDVLIPIAVGAVVVAAAPVIVRRASWPALLWLVAAASLAWWLSLTTVDLLKEIEKPLRIKTQYINAVDDVGSPGAFLSNFVDRIDDYPSHVRAHPPLMVLALWGLDEIGLGGTWWAAFAILLVAASAAPAVLIAARRLAGEDAARRAAPYFVLGCAALSIATTADAAYMAVAAWGVTAVVIALDREPGPRADVLAAAGGLLLGLALFCSYGLVLIATIPLAVAWDRRRLRPLVLALLGSLVVVGAFALAGFWWLDGFFATRREYRQSVASTRPYEFFLFNNLAAFGIWLGPAVIVGLAVLRDRRVWLLVGGGLAAALLADVSGMSKAEVERIWLPFLPWIVLAAAALPAAHLRRWLAVQAALGIVVAVSVNTLW